MSAFCDKRVLITGASGFIGSHLARRLAELGAEVTALYNRSQPDWTSSGCSWRQLDLLDSEQTKAVVEEARPAIVFHLAANPDGSESHAQALASLHANTCMTLNLLEACRLAGVRTVIYGDSCKVYGNGGVPYTCSQPPQPLCSYAIGKLAGWELCLLYHRLYDFDVVSIRPTLVYGPGQGRNLISSILGRLAAGEQSVDLLGGDQTRDPLYISDAVEAFLRAAERSDLLTGEVIIVGGGREETVYTLAQQIVAAAGTTARVKVSPSLLRPNDVLRSFCDNQEARDRLAWNPAVTFFAGLRLTLSASGWSPQSQPFPLEA